MDESWRCASSVRNADIWLVRRAYAIARDFNVRRSLTWRTSAPHGRILALFGGRWAVGR